MVAQIRMRDSGGTLRTLARIRMRDEGGVLRTIQRIRIRDVSNILRTVWQSMTAAASPGVISATGSTSTITTTSAAVAVTGGTSPFTYLWSPAAYNTDSVGITSPTAAITTFRRGACNSGDTYLGDFTCEVTDALGVVATTNVVSVDITRT